MAEADWRRLQRAWEASPADQETLRALIAALRRAGQPVPGDLLDERLNPPRSFRCGMAARVYAWLPEEDTVQHYEPPQGDERLEVPTHQLLGVVTAAGNDQAFEPVIRSLADDPPDRLDLLLDEPLGPETFRCLRDHLPGLQGLRLQGGEEAYELAPEALAHVLSLPELDTLALNQISLRGGFEGARSPLSRLNLDGGTVTREALDELARSDTLLTELEMSFVPLFDGVLEPIGQLRHLRALELWGEDDYHERGIAGLAGLPLDRLSLLRCRVTPQGLRALSELDSLRHLWIGTYSDMIYTESWTQPLADLPLEDLLLEGDRITAAAARQLPATLEDLSLCSLSDLESLSHLRRLEALRLDLQHIDPGLEPLRTFRELRSLRLRRIGLETSLAAIEDLPLESLSLSGRLEGAALAAASRMKSLRELELSLSFRRGTPPLDLAPLDGARIERLELGGRRVLEASPTLPTLPKLRELRVATRDTFTSELLAWIAGMPGLRKLELSGLILDEPERLLGLGELTQLQALELRYLRHGGDALVKRLGEALPNCTVSWQNEL